MSDQLTGLYAAYGILAALAAGGRTGKGQRSEGSMLPASMASLPEPLANYLLLGEVSDLRSRPRRSQSYAFVARDGKPFAIHLSSPPKFWEALTEAVERPDLLADARFVTKADRVKSYDALRATLEETFRTRDRAEWLARPERCGGPPPPPHDLPDAGPRPPAPHH